MSKVIANNVNVRDGPSTSANSVAKYSKGEIINSGNLLIENEGRIWLRYKGSSGNQRYICAINNNGEVYVDVASGIPGPRSLNQGSGSSSGGKTESGWVITFYCACIKCCGKSDAITASGYKLKESDSFKVCAAPKEIPFHTMIKVSGGWNGTVKVEDRGSAIKGKRLDIYCYNHNECNKMGKRENCTVSY